MSMTVAALIDLLEGYPSDLRVVVDEYEAGYDDLTPERISIVNISLDIGTYFWERKHGDPPSKAGDDPNAVETTAALILRPNSSRKAYSDIRYD